jgi:lipid-binding SYLF domain-containing protein
MIRRNAFIAVIGFLLLGLAFARPAMALSDQQEIIDKARITFDKLIQSPEFAELPNYVKRAKALMIFPELIKGGFIIGGEGGSGVLVVRDTNQGWSNPAFYTLAAGSLGLQIGGQVSEVVLTIMSEKALDAVIDNQMKLGGEVSMAAGPLGKGLEASTTTNLESDVYSFAKTAGLFGGVSLEGAGILKRDSWNASYYGTGATPYAIVIERRFTNPNAQPLRDALSPY